MQSAAVGAVSYPHVATTQPSNWKLLNYKQSPARIPLKEALAGHLYLGAGEYSVDENWLNSVNVTHVVSMMPSSEKWYSQQREIYNRLNIVQFVYPVLDSPYESLNFRTMFLQEVHQLLEEGKNIFVHCEKGISRSCTFCTAYMMLFENYSAFDAYHSIRKVRSVVCPNIGFWQQLLLLDFALNIQKARSTNGVQVVPKNMVVTMDHLNRSKRLPFEAKNVAIENSYVPSNAVVAPARRANTKDPQQQFKFVTPSVPPLHLRTRETLPYHPGPHMSMMTVGSPLAEDGKSNIGNRPPSIVDMPRTHTLSRREKPAGVSVIGLRPPPHQHGAKQHPGSGGTTLGTRNSSKNRAALRRKLGHVPAGGSGTALGSRGKHPTNQKKNRRP